MTRLAAAVPLLVTVLGLVLVVAAVAALAGAWWAVGTAGVVLVVAGERGDW